MSDALEPADRASAPSDRLPKPVSSALQYLRRYELWIVVLAAVVILVPGLWSYTLVDPWETHYGEVGRRMLQDHDWVQLKWQNEDFDSKPVLTFWLMAAGMKVLGVAADGGYSGELTASALSIAAIRLPFVLFGIFGLAVTWWMLARLVSRRVAWLTFLVLATTPFYFFVARQGITDMPMVAALMGSVACVAMVVAQRDGPLEPIFRRWNGLHVFLAFLIVTVGVQLLYFAIHFTGHGVLAPGLRVPVPWLWFVVMAAVLGAFVWLTAFWKPLTRKHSIYVLWLFALIGISILGKGPPAAAIIAFITIFYVALARRWDLVRSRETWLDIARGLVVMVLIALPWHIAIFFKQGLRWINVYLRTHIMQRAFSGVHGDRGTFDYYAAQLGIGMWPWIALLPGALATVLTARLARSAESNIRLLVGTWAVVGFTLFAAVQTKFHHYALPVVPALAILIAFFLDDLLRGAIRKSGLFMVVAAVIVLVIVRDLVFEQKQFIELFVYRHDRPWPSGKPWFVDVGTPIIVFGCAFAALFLTLPFAALRRFSFPALGLAALGFAYWAMNGYMGAAAPHWGQGPLHEIYYAERTIYGVEIEYYSLRDLADQWGNANATTVHSVLPTDFRSGQPATVTIRVPGAGIPGDRVELQGKVGRIDGDSFAIEVPESEHAKLDDLIARGKSAAPSRRSPRSQVDADRLVAWQLNWRGENFWSNGEVWGPFPETQTVFMKTDNEEFLTYLKDLGRPGRRYFLITEAARANTLKNILPTDRARATFEILDTSNNKFTLLSFTL